MFPSLDKEDLHCNGTESDIDECASYPWKANSAHTPCNSHSLDVGVNCMQKPIKGRVEVQYRRYDQELQKYRDDHWGTICDDKFGDDDALVLCSMMGYSRERERERRERERERERERF
ncbi:hypothetical protein DPMN_035977 [Dreissena polymorpha]|uniref:SRCR domain-containing protein n=1 Tax=Dreissena polymorpha TaxID=45954 RepID=A0A9D4MAP1_DREPO|nr:hypothetical protein DPMN_035977 [Dreissena polymorpha]